MSDWVQTPLPGFDESLPVKVARAIDRLRFYEHTALMHDARGYHLCYSGGKDSGVIKRLAEMSGVRFTVHRNICPDPPELVSFVRRACPEAIWERHETAFFPLVARKGLPTRFMRWCCEHFKERGGKGRLKIMGVRAAESPRRKKGWKVMGKHKRTGTWSLQPILEWTNEDVWQFTLEQGIPYCELYREGFDRLGCVGCPLASAKNRRRELDRWPRYERLWRQAAHKLWERRAGTKQTDGREWFASAKFRGPDEFFRWWLTDERLPESTCEE